MPRYVTTYQTARGLRLRLCDEHARDVGPIRWYRDPRTGENYSSVHRGRTALPPTYAGCDVCEGRTDAVQHVRGIAVPRDVGPNEATIQ